MLTKLVAGQIHPEETSDLLEQREILEEEIADLELQCRPLLDILRNEEQTRELTESGEFTFDKFSEIGIDNTILELFYRYCKLKYEIGHYQETSYMLHYYRLLAPNAPDVFRVSWGKLASELLVLRTPENVSMALKELKKLQETLDGRDESAEKTTSHNLEQLQYRSWMLHWSLFLFFRPHLQDSEKEETEDESSTTTEVQDGNALKKQLLSEMVEFFFVRKNFDALQTNCPHLLRYAAVAIILLNGQPRKWRNKLSNTIQQESYEYSDPLTELIDCLYVNFDYVKALEILKVCEVVLQTDFFLHHLVSDFKKAAQTAIFEVFCRIHTKIDTAMLAGILNFEEESNSDDKSEQRLVQLIQRTGLDAKIDSTQNCVVMDYQQPDIYSQIIGKTKDLVYRSYQLCNDVQHLHQREERDREKN